MKTLLSLFLLLSSYASIACSVGFNEQNIKNSKVAAAANEFNINLTKATKISVQNFDVSILAEEPVYQCPTLIHIDSIVTIKYKKNLTTTCELSVTVRDVLDEVAGGTTYEFLYPSSSCTYTPIRIIPRLPGVLRPNP
tara:strand:+ start:35462 stop:35875 length:414 start_codon:yes stop_codon:yes gene_type:complete